MTSLDLLAIHYSADYEGFNTRDLKEAKAMLEEFGVRAAGEGSLRPFIHGRDKAVLDHALISEQEIALRDA